MHTSHVRPGKRTWLVGLLCLAALIICVVHDQPLRTILSVSGPSSLHQRSLVSHSEGSSASFARLASIFQLRPPPVVELPFSSDPTLQGNGSFARFSLQRNLTFGGDNALKLNIYVYSEGDFVSTKIATKGRWESYLVRYFVGEMRQFAKARSLAPEEVYFIDIGANLGSITLGVAAHGFRVISFEAMYANALALELSLLANPGLRERVTLINKGLGQHAVNCTIFSPADNVGDGSVRCGPEPSVPKGWTKRGMLGIERLDDLLASSFSKLKGRVGAVKMDVEGYEPWVVVGGQQFFREVAPPVVTAECDEPLLRGAASSGAQLRSKMLELGYAVESMHRTGWRPVPREEWDSTCADTFLNFRRAAAL